jgi:hypothetical protein
MRTGKRFRWLAPALAMTAVALAGCAGNSPRTPTASAGSTTPSATSRPGVLADCTDPPPFKLQREPTSIVVACADGGLGAKDLTWSAWTATGARGNGTVYENDCTPDCADGVFKDYPASITLSAVRSTSVGAAFTVLKATYDGAGPNGNQTDTFHLEIPPT